MTWCDSHMNKCQLRPVRILVERYEDYPLSSSEIEYVFETLLTIAGLSWQFIPTSQSDSCDIYFGYRYVQVRNAKILIRMEANRKNGVMHPMSSDKTPSLTFLWFGQGKRYAASVVEHANDHVVVHNDIIFTAYYLLSGWEEKFIRRDKKDRHDIRDIFLYQNDLLHTPMVNQYARLFQSGFSSTHSFLPLWPGGKQYALALTHDVDYPEIIPCIEAFRYIVHNKGRSRFSKICDILTRKEHFFKFRDWLDLEKKCGMKSAFYFCGCKSSLLRYAFIAPDPFYDVREKHFRDVMHMIDDNGCEVGMHSSYFAYRSEQQFREEKANVEDSFGKAVYGNRHHYWHMNPDNPSETAQLHRRIGLLYDSSICFEKHSGFRRGICVPFHLYDGERGEWVDTIQLPTILMDNHLFGYCRNSRFDSYQDHVSSLLKAVRTCNGIFVVDYHVRVLNDTLFPDWGRSYEFLLDSIIAEKDCYNDTPVNIVRHWMSREKILREASFR